MRDFLDDLASDEQYNPNVDQGIMGKIEWLIWQSSLSDQEKARETKRMLRLESMEQAHFMVKWLQDFQPVVGQDRAPVTQYEVVEATRRRVERDDFKERKK